MSQPRPHCVRKKITYMVRIALRGALLGALVGGVPALFVWSDEHGPDNMGDKIVLIALPCAGALIGCIISTLSTKPKQASTSQTERPGFPPTGTTYNCFQELMSKLKSQFPASPECRPNADIDLEAQTRQQSEPNTTSKVPRESLSRGFFASVLRADIPQAPPPSYTPENREPNFPSDNSSAGSPDTDNL